MKTRIRAHQPNAKVSFFFDSEIPKYQISVRSLEAEATSLRALSLDSSTLQAANYLMSDLRSTLSQLLGLRKQLEDLRSSGEISSNLEMGRRFPGWVDSVDDLIRRVKMAMSTVSSVIASAQQQAPTKGAKGIYGNQSKVADVITLAFVIGAGYTIYKASK